jgi:hypothetical protein
MHSANVADNATDEFEWEIFGKLSRQSAAG